MHKIIFLLDLKVNFVIIPTADLPTHYLVGNGDETIEKGSGKPNKDKVAKLTKSQIRKIAELKMPDLNASSIEAAMSMVAGTARSMGVVVAD